MRMEKIWFPVAMSFLLSIGLIIGCGQPAAKLPEQAISEIYAITSEPIVSQYAQIRDVEGKGPYCYIVINMIYDPELIINLEDAYIQAEVCTDAIAQNTVKILKKYGVERDVSVWAQFPLGEGEAVLLGNTWYDAETQHYEFKRYKQ